MAMSTNRGFHRIGVVLGIIIAAPAVPLLAIAAYGLMKHDENLMSYAVIGFPLLLLAGAAYGFVRSIGWIVNGFSKSD